MYGNTTEKLTALSFSCNEDTVKFFSGKGGILENHKTFGGLGKSEFLRIAVAHALNNPPTKAQFLELLKYSKNAVAFASFCSTFKGGPKN